MAEGRHISQSIEGTGDNIGKRGQKLCTPHAPKLSSVGVIGKKDPQKGGRQCGNAGVDQAVLKRAPLRTRELSKVFQCKF